MNYVIGPAYGRDYTKAKDAEDAFVSGLDFRNHTVTVRGSYLNVSHLKDGDTVEIRFKNLERATLVTAERAKLRNKHFKELLNAL